MPTFSTTRSTDIAAPPEAVHALLDDFREWRAWSPWEDVDPALRRTYTGPERGVGSHYEWSGNRKAGSGAMEIIASTPREVTVDLRFLAPFKARNTVTFELTPVQVGGRTGTRVEWTMSGRRNIAFEVLGRLFLDKAIAKDFDRGLARLKATVEGRPGA